MANIKPTVLGRLFMVAEGDGSIFFIGEHHLSGYFWVLNTSTMTDPLGYFKTTVWEQIDRKQWLILPPKDYLI